MSKNKILLTRDRKSTWYELIGVFEIKSILFDQGTIPNSTAELSFQPEGEPDAILLVPAENQFNVKKASRKVLGSIYPLKDIDSTDQWADTLYLRHIVRTCPNADPNGYWQADVVGADGAVELTALAKRVAGKQFTDTWIKRLLPLAKKIDWPQALTNDETAECGPSQNSVDEP